MSPALEQKQVGIAPSEPYQNKIREERWLPREKKNCNAVTRKIIIITITYDKEFTASTKNLLPGY